MSEAPKSQESKVKAIDLKKYFGDLLKDIFDLDKGVDKWATIREIKSKQSMSGANAWMLICSIMIASIGLNLDSQAVIIGAMLISPLMSPILGIGLGVGINDKDALYHALMHFGAAILIAIVTSTLYFWLSPLDDFTPQIKARTEPTFLDILIAIFGGIAGIISIARKDISTTLPGVAIATALMPPICVAGYGIANGSWGIASKAFYLFFLNSFFVAFATYVIIRQMNFPFKDYADPKERKKNMIWVALFSLMMIIPSVLIFISVYKDWDRERILNQFIELNFTSSEKNHLDDYKLLPPEEPTKLLLKVYGDVISEDRIPFYKEKLAYMGLDQITDVEIISTSEIDLDDINEVSSELKGLDDKIEAQINQLQEEREAFISHFEQTQAERRLNRFDSLKFSKVVNQLKIFYPEIEEISMGVTQTMDFDKGLIKLPMVVIKKDKSSDEDMDKIASFIHDNFELDTLKVIVE